MTTLRINCNDDTLTALDTISQRTAQSPELIAEKLLRTAALTLPFETRAVVVYGEALEKLAEILGGGAVLSQEDLLKKVQRLAGISFLHARLPFTPNQLEQLQERADRQGLTVQQLVDRTAPRIYEHFFNLLERTTG